MSWNGGDNFTTSGAVGGRNRSIGGNSRDFSMTVGSYGMSKDGFTGGSFDLFPANQQRHEANFYSFNPQNGQLSGQVARNIFMQSGLPNAVLASIWALSDVNRSGGVDVRGYTVAMTLIEGVRAGIPLPQKLPPHLMRYLTENSTNDNSNGVSNVGGVGNVNWVVTPAERMKSTRSFQQIDKNRNGIISGMQARSILVATGLPQNTLACIWSLADVDRDGFMDPDEFALAMHLVEMAKGGLPLPGVLPPNFVPPSHRQHTNSSYAGGSAVSSYNSSDIKGQYGSSLGGVPDSLSRKSSVDSISFSRSSSVTNIEDRRKENFLRGQEELERRRREMREAQEREKLEADRLKEEEKEKARKKIEAMRLERERLQQQQRIRAEEEARRREDERLKELEKAARERENLKYEAWKRAKQREMEGELNAISRNISRLCSRRGSLDAELNELTKRKTQLRRVIEDRNSLITRESQILQTLKWSVEEAESAVERAHADLNTTNNRLTGLKYDAENASREASRSSTRATEEQRRVAEDTARTTETLSRLRRSIERNRQLLTAQQRSLLERQDAILINRRRLDVARNDFIDAKNAYVVRKETEKKRLDDERRQRLEREKEEANLCRRREENARRLEQQRLEAEALEQRRRENDAARVKKEKEMRELREAKEREQDQERENQRKREEDAANARHALQLTLNTEKPTEEPTPDAGPATSQLIKYVALFPYTADPAISDEVSLTTGDIVMIDVSAQNSSSDWWHGMVKSAHGDIVGVFPKSYVEPAEKPTTLERNIVRLSKLTSMTQSSSSLCSSNGSGGKRRLNEPHIALFDYDAASAQELSFRVNDVITVTRKQNGGWWKGILNCESGWFPMDYVSPVSQESTPSGETISKSASEPVPIVPSSYVSEAAVTAADATLSSDQKGDEYIAIYSYSSEEANDLHFKENDIVVITSKMDSGWWEGRCNNRSGWFPSNYVKPIAVQNVVDSSKTKSVAAEVATPVHTYVKDSSDTAKALYAYTATKDDELSFDENANIDILDRPDNKWWLGSHAGSKGWFPASYVQACETPSTISAQNVSSIEKPRDRVVAKVVKAYDSERDGELTLKVGILIQVLSQDTNGWWDGEIKKRGQGTQRGKFPRECVRVMESKGSKRSIDSFSGKQTPVRTLSRSSTSSQSPTTSVCVVGYAVKALYAYVANKSDELSFNEGDIIQVKGLLTKDAWWEGTLSGKTGWFPSNYVVEANIEQQGNVMATPMKNTGTTTSNRPINMVTDNVSWASVVDQSVLTTLSNEEQKRQQLIFELICTEQAYVHNLATVIEVFYEPIKHAAWLKPSDRETIFQNWLNLHTYNSQLLKSLQDRQVVDNFVVQRIGEILVNKFPTLKGYVFFCSGQLRACEFVQQLLRNVSFEELMKKCMKDNAHRTGGLSLSSFLLKPMQRVTRYPLLLKKILHHTPVGHPDHDDLAVSLELCEDLASSVNEGVRRKENELDLMRIQSRLHLDGLSEELILTSDTHTLGPRIFLYEGKLWKDKSGKELYAYLFNDLFLLCAPKPRPKGLSTTLTLGLLGSSHGKGEFEVPLQLYRPPIPVLEIAMKDVDTSRSKVKGDDVFVLQHPDEQITLKAMSVKDKKTWIEKITDAVRNYMEVEVGQEPIVVAPSSTTVSSRKTSADKNRPTGSFIATLSVVVVEGKNLLGMDNNNLSDPYCVVRLGKQQMKTKVVKTTLNPKWNSDMIFTVYSLSDKLRFTVFDEDKFSTDDFMGETEVDLASFECSPTPMSLKLTKVPSGEILVQLHLNFV